MAVINTNAKALFSQAALKLTDRGMSVAMQQLSTGKRINSARDDAAGLSIVTRMTEQIRGLNQAVRNANDAINLIQTAEGATNEITDMMQRMRELAVQAVNDTNSNADRSYLDLEFQQLKQQIVQISDNTEWNGFTVLNGTAGQRVGEMPLYKVTSDNQFGGVFIQPTTSKTVSGADAGEMQQFTLSGAPTGGSLTVGDGPSLVINSDDSLAGAADRLIKQLNSSTDFVSNGITASHAIPTQNWAAGHDGVYGSTSIAFKDMKAGQQVTMAGVTFKAKADLTSQEVAGIFKDYLAVAPVTPDAAKGTISGVLTIGTGTYNVVNVATIATTAATAGTPGVDAITLQDMKAGDTVTVNGVKFTAASNLQGSQVASLFKDYFQATPTTPSASYGAFSGSPDVLTDVATATAYENTLTFTATANNVDPAIADPTSTSSVLTFTSTTTLDPVLTPNGGPPVTDTDVTFKDMDPGNSVTVDGVTFTAKTSVAKADVATYFLDYFNNSTSPAASVGVFSGDRYTAGAVTAGGSAEIINFAGDAIITADSSAAVTLNVGGSVTVDYSASNGDVPTLTLKTNDTGLTLSSVTKSRYAVTTAEENIANSGKFLQSGAFQINMPSGAAVGTPIVATFTNSLNQRIQLTGAVSSINPATVRFAAVDGLNGQVISDDLTYTLKQSNDGELTGVDLSNTTRALSLTIGVQGSIPGLRDGDLLINGVNVGQTRATDDTLSPLNNAAGSAIAKAAAINRVAVDQGISQGEIQSLTFTGTPTVPGTITVAGVNITLASTQNTPALVATAVATALQSSPQFNTSTGRIVSYAPGSPTLTISYPVSDRNPAKVAIEPGATGIGSVVNTIQEYATTTKGTGVFAKVNENVFSGQAMVQGPVEKGIVFINGYASAEFTTVYNNSQATRTNTVRAINLISDKTGIKAIDTGSDDKGIQLIAVDGRNIEVRFAPDASSNPISFGQRIGMREGVQSSTISLESKIDAPVVLTSSPSGDITRAGLKSGNYSKNEAVLNTKARAPVDAATAQVSAVDISGTLAVGKTETININAVNYTVARTGDGSGAVMAQALIAKINADATCAVFASLGEKPGQVLLKAKTPGTPFTMTASTSDVAGGGAVTASTLVPNQTASIKMLSANDLVINGVRVRSATPEDDKFSNTLVSSSDPSASAIAIAAAINGSTSLTGVTAYANPAEIVGNVTTTKTPIGIGEHSLFINGREIKVKFDSSDTVSVRCNRVAEAINTYTGDHGVVATNNGDKGVALATKDGRNLSVWFDSNDKEVKASDFGLGRGGAVAQQSKITLSDAAAAGKVSFNVNGVAVYATVAQNDTAATIATALTTKFNALQTTGNFPNVKLTNNGDGTLSLVSGVAGSSFDVRVSDDATNGNTVGDVMSIATVVPNKPDDSDVSAVNLSAEYASNVLGVPNAPLSAMNIRTVYGTVRMVASAPMLPTMPGADGLTPSSLNAEGRPILIQAGTDGFGSLSNFADLGFNEGTFGGRASEDMAPPRVGRLSFQVGSGANQVVTIDLADFGKKGAITGSITGDVDLEVDQRSVRINTREGASAVLNLLDTAMDKVNATRATMGAVMNRLDHVVNNLTNVSMNMSASRSQIQDADYAQASTDLAKSQIMQQAATAVLAQANTSQQSVLKLLGG